MFAEGLSEKDLKRLEKIGTLKSYSKGDYIIKEGAEGSVFSVILGGEVEVRKTVTSGQSTAVVKLGPADVVGEMGFFGIKSRSASVIAVSDCELLEFEHDAFDVFARSKPKIGLILYRNMAGILAQRLEETDAKLKDAVLWTISPGRDADFTSAMRIRQNSKLQFWG